MQGHASVSVDVLVRYAADAAQEVEGVRGLVANQLHRHRGVRVVRSSGTATVELHLDIDWGGRIPDIGRTVQTRVGDYLERMVGSRPAAVHIVVDAVGPAE